MNVPKPRKLKSGTWFIQLRLGGESVSVSGKTEKEVIKEARYIKAEYLAGKRLPTVEEEATKKITLSQAIDEYIENRTNTLSPLTIRGYRIIQKNRFQSEMDRPIEEIDPKEWQGIINKEAGLCSPKTLKTAWGFIRSVVKNETGAFPPDVTLPSPAPPEKPFLTPEQIKVFIAAVKDTRYATPCLLALSSLRASEIEALRWENIPNKPEFIKVSGAVVLNENNQKVKKKQNKNATSSRNVPVMIPELSAAIERDRKKTGPVMPYHQNSLRVAIKKICEQNGLPNVGIHGLRHSFASLAYHLQIPEKIAMEIGGWADATTMHKIYTHIAQSDVKRYQTKMTSFFKNANKNANKPAKR